MSRRGRRSLQAGGIERLVADAAFTELVKRVLPYLSADERTVLELVLGGRDEEEVADALGLPATQRKGRPMPRGRGSVDRALQSLIVVCQAVAAAPLLLEEGFDCEGLRSAIDEWAEFAPGVLRQRRIQAGQGPKIYATDDENGNGPTRVNAGFGARTDQRDGAADAGALRGAPSHIRFCSNCRAAAQRVLGEHWSPL